MSARSFTANNRIIIITVPHGFCFYQSLGFDTRDCDKRALDASIILYNKLKERNNVPLIFLSNIKRSKIDLNRPWSRFTEWRQQINDTLRELKNLNPQAKLILVDMHSFPQETENTKGWKKIAFLDTEETETVNNLINKLNDGLGKGTIISNFVQGSNINDIQITSRRYVDFSFLIENNEYIENFTEDELRKAYDIIADYLLTFPITEKVVDINYSNYPKCFIM